MKEKELPKGWECVKIGDIATHVSSGSTPRGGEDVYDKEGILFIRSQNIHMNKIIFENIAHISNEIHQSMPRSWVKKGDVLFNITGASIGRVACFNGEDNSANVNQHVCIIRTDKKKVIPEFLSYQLSQPSYQCKILANQSGATRQAFNYTQIKNFEIPLPPLHIQHQIVAVLEQAETVKRQRRDADTLTGALLQSVFRKMFGDSVRNESGWDIVKLESICTKITDGTHVTPTYIEKGVSFLSVKNLTKGYLDFDNVKYISESEHRYFTKRCKPERGDILYTKVGTYGKAEVVNVDTEFSIFVSLSLLKPQHEKIDSYYLKFILNSPHVKRQADNRIRGIGVPDLHLIEIKQFKIPLPPLVLQQQFARVVQDVERIREQQVASGKEIEGLFEGLMQTAFRGESVA